MIIEEISDTGASKHWTYEENSFRPLAKIENGQVLASINDQSGKPLELFNQAGDAAWRQRTNLWSANTGEQAAQTNCDIRFQEQWFDEESASPNKSRTKSRIVQNRLTANFCRMIRDTRKRWCGFARRPDRRSGMSFADSLLLVEFFFRFQNGVRRLNHRVGI